MFSAIQGVVVYPDHHRIYVPAPKESRNSSSTVFSTWPVSSYCCRFTLLESTSYALWIFANLSGSPPLSGCSRVIKFLYARRIYTYTYTYTHTHTHYRFLSQFPFPLLLLSSFLVSSRIILTSTSLAPLSTPSTAYKSLSAAISLSLFLRRFTSRSLSLPPFFLALRVLPLPLPPFLLLLIPVTP